VTALQAENKQLKAELHRTSQTAAPQTDKMEKLATKNSELTAANRKLQAQVTALEADVAKAKAVAEEQAAEAARHKKVAAKAQSDALKARQDTGKQDDVAKQLAELQTLHAAAVEKNTQLQEALADHLQQINRLKAELKAANAKADKPSAEPSDPHLAANHKILQVEHARLQQQLTLAQQQAAAAAAAAAEAKTSASSQDSEVKRRRERKKERKYGGMGCCVDAKCRPFLSFFPSFFSSFASCLWSSAGGGAECGEQEAAGRG
jgi:hypothetical protein